jgi:hypothetical protein
MNIASARYSLRLPELLVLAGVEPLGAVGVLPARWAQEPGGLERR